MAASSASVPGARASNDLYHHLMLYTHDANIPSLGYDGIITYFADIPAGAVSDKARKAANDVFFGCLMSQSTQPGNELRIDPRANAPLQYSNTTP